MREVALCRVGVSRRLRRSEPTLFLLHTKRSLPEVSVSNYLPLIICTISLCSAQSEESSFRDSKQARRTSKNLPELRPLMNHSSSSIISTVTELKWYFRCKHLKHSFFQQHLLSHPLCARHCFKVIGTKKNIIILKLSPKRQHCERVGSHHRINELKYAQDQPRNTLFEPNETFCENSSLLNSSYF